LGKGRKDAPLPEKGRLFFICTERRGRKKKKKGGRTLVNGQRGRGGKKRSLTPHLPSERRGGKKKKGKKKEKGERSRWPQKKSRNRPLSLKEKKTTAKGEGKEGRGKRGEGG